MAADGQRASGPAASKHQNAGHDAEHGGGGRSRRGSGRAAAAVKDRDEAADQGPEDGPAMKGAGEAGGGGEENQAADADFADPAGEDLDIEVDLDGEPDLAAVADLDVDADLADLESTEDDSDEAVVLEDGEAADADDTSEDATTPAAAGAVAGPDKEPAEVITVVGQVQVVVKPAGEENEDEAFVYGDDDEDLPAAQVAVAGATSDPVKARDLVTRGGPSEGAAGSAARARSATSSTHASSSG